MPTPHTLLKAAALAVLNAMPTARTGELLPTLSSELARHVWAEWARDRSEEERRSELQALIQTNAEEIGRQAAEIVQEVAGDLPDDIRQLLTTYLIHVPESLRQSFRRLADPTGSTVPGDVALRQADDLIPLLPARLPHFKPGDRPLAGVDLVLVELLGVGGFGEVWKACNPHFDGVPPVALKFCLERAAKDRLLRHEAAVLNQVMRQGTHPGIVPLLRTYLNADPPCLEYEYVEGGDLGALIHDWHRYQGGPTPPLALKVLRRLAEIIAFAHRQDPPIVHRDLKPGNILVQRSPTGKVAFRIADFGIGGLAAAHRQQERSAPESDALSARDVQGTFTPLYASPQQSKGEPPDPRDDVFSLGVIGWQLLTGSLAGGGPPTQDWRTRLQTRGTPPDFIELLAACVADNADQRPADAGALMDRLEALTQAQPPTAAGPAQDTVRAFSLTESTIQAFQPRETEAAPADQDPATEMLHLLQKAAFAHEQAHHFAEQENDYAAAVQVLESLPEHLRDAVFHETVRERRDLVLQLEQELQAALAGRQLGAMQSKATALLQLQPRRTDLRELLEKLGAASPNRPSSTDS